MVFSFLVRFAETQREAIDVNGFLAIDTARLDGLREEFVDSIGGLVVDAGVAFLEGPLELFGHLVLWGDRLCGRIECRESRDVDNRVVWWFLESDVWRVRIEGRRKIRTQNDND